MTTSRKALAYRLLALAGLVLLATAYFSPIWWVSLKAPQYPDVAFPQGIRIHFHMDGVFNGCQLIESAEKTEAEVLNCKHEMDAINHFVGMYPIAVGGPVERAFAPFLFSLLGLMVIGFVIIAPRRRAIVLTLGAVGIAAWMSAAMHSEGGFRLMSPNYVKDVTSTMGVEPNEYAAWSGFTAIREGYNEALGRYFREKVEIDRRVDAMLAAGHVVYWGVMVGLAVLVFAAWRVHFITWVLILMPALVPVAFVVEYAAWLWWFGHNLHEMAAFTLKPFMPTVFGEGKVAQFHTFSYPHYGYGLTVAAAVLFLAAALVRLKQSREG